MQPNQTDSKTVQQTEGGGTVASSALLAAADPFIRVLAISDALPPAYRDDSQPLSKHIPGIWPTLGELRKLVTEIHKAANS